MNVEKRAYCATNGKHGRISREVLMRAHDAKSPKQRELAWGEGYWAYEKAAYKIGHRPPPKRRHQYIPINIVKDEDGYWVAEH